MKVKIPVCNWHNADEIMYLAHIFFSLSNEILANNPLMSQPLAQGSETFESYDSPPYL